MIHLSEINTIIIDNMFSSVSTYLINQLNKNKIKVIFCDEKHNPSSEIVLYYGSFDTSSKIANEIRWDSEYSKEVWREIVKHKILYQAEVLKNTNNNAYIKLLEYYENVKDDDETNREGHAAKVYFNALFGNNFSRDDDKNNINSYLNYGYSIILSSVNRAVVQNGYITQIGIHHRGYNNPFNLSCDLMEIFRPIIDLYVYENYLNSEEFASESKMEIVDLLNKKYLYLGKEQYLVNVIDSFVRKVLQSFDNKTLKIEWFEYGYTKE